MLHSAYTTNLLLKSARAPHFYEWLGTGGTVSRRTTNKKLTKLY